MGEDAKCAYVPAAGAVAESRHEDAAIAVSWTPEALALLERIPGFVRGRVRDRLEEAAARESAASITLDFMRAHRPQGSFLATLRGRPS